MTALSLFILTWVVLGLLALLEGTLNDTNQTISFFEDFLMHVRFVFVVPFLIIIERVIDTSFINFLKNTNRVIVKSEQGKFTCFVKKLDKITDSILPEVLFLVLVYLLVILDWSEVSFFNSNRNYLLSGDSLNIAGWYYLLVCTPILQLIVFRWLWRCSIWICSMFCIARFNIQTDPLHADKMGGLEFLNLVPLSLSYLLIAPSALLAAHVGVEVMYEGALL